MRYFRKYLCASLCLLLSACGGVRKLPVREQTVYRMVDKVRYYDSVAFFHIPLERVKEVKPMYERLRMETSMAVAEAYVDTATNTLKGKMWNKTDSLPFRIKWKETIVTRDSLVTKEVPVPVEVEKVRYPKTYWWLLGFFLSIVGLAGFKIYRKVALR